MQSGFSPPGDFFSYWKRSTVLSHSRSHTHVTLSLLSPHYPSPGIRAVLPGPHSSCGLGDTARSNWDPWVSSFLPLGFSSIKTAHFQANSQERVQKQMHFWMFCMSGNPAVSPHTWLMVWLWSSRLKLTWNLEWLVNILMPFRLWCLCRWSAFFYGSS